MAAKSDFAKKLLHDLRLRKERMAASHSSNNSRMTSTRDACVDPVQTYRGSRQNKALELIGTKTSSTHRRSASRPLTNGESSNQIVNYARTQSSQQIGDLSMALLLALENGGKLSAMDSKGNRSTLGFIKPRSSTSTSQFPTISHLHINDISKGVQNLNKILRACSNGVNLDNYSIQVGKELLKGAIDLEESLRMLVNLQESSEYMVPQQRKNRLTLLQEDEDDEAASSAKLSGDKQLGPPKFSFDKPSKSSRDLNNRMMALTYLTDDKQALTTSTLWNRLQNYKPEPKNETGSPPAKQEKVRISNVIAKLMGLEEVPLKMDSKNIEKESSLKKKEGTQKNFENLATLATNNKVVTPSKRIPLAPSQAQPPAPPRATFPARSTPIMLKVERSRVSSRVNLDEKVSKKNNERANKTTATSSKRQNVAIDRKQQGNQFLENRKIQENGRDMESRKQNEGKHKENGESKEVVFKDELHKKVEHEGTTPQAANVLHEKNMKNERSLQTEKNQEGKREQLTKKQLLQDKKLDGNELKFKGPSKPIGSQKKHLQVNQMVVHSKPSKDLPSKVTIKSQDATAKKRGPIVEKQVHGNKSYIKVDEVMARRNSTRTNSVGPLKHNSSIVKDQRRREVEKVNKSKGVKPSTFSTPKEKNGGDDVTNQLEEAIKIPDEPQHQNLDTPILDDNFTKTDSEVHTVLKDYEEQAPVISEDPEVPLDEFSPNRITGVYDGAKPTPRYHYEHKKVSKLFIQEPLTENEKHLKEILIKGQIFLNSAEALFKLNIPINMLHNIDYICRDSNTKLILDCGCEVMNRKRRIQELNVHPFVNIPIGKIKLKSFDDLVKQLYKDFEWLRLWNGIDVCDASSYLQKMLERDIENNVPDLNCMWESGWNKSMFVYEEKDDVVRVVECKVFDGLVDEIIDDFLSGIIAT